MSNLYKLYSEKFDDLSVRERILILVTLLVVVGYLWWFFYAQAQLVATQGLEQKNIALENEIQSLDLVAQQISQRIEQGVHNSKQQQLALLDEELERVNQVLKEKTLALIEPDEMFRLMQELIFSESRLKLTGLKRKLVRPAFENTGNEDSQPEIYRHVMQVNIQGKYLDVLNYISRLEELEWKLIWDGIRLTTETYPQLDVEIEISTLSDSQHWVGL